MTLRVPQQWRGAARGGGGLRYQARIVQLADDIAGVGHGPAHVEAALDHAPGRHTSADRHVQAVIVFLLLAVVRRAGLNRIHEPHLARVQVVETAHLIAAATREARIRRHRDAERIVVRGRRQQIVGHDEVTEDPAVVAGLQRDIRPQLGLQRPHELPVIGARAEAVRPVAVEPEVGDLFAEVRVGRRRPARRSARGSADRRRRRSRCFCRSTSD